MVRLLSAYAEKDPFVRADRVLSVLDGMSAEDFRSIGSSAIVKILNSRSREAEVTEPFLEEFVMRWLELDSEGAIGSITRNENEDDLRCALARVRPEAELELLNGGKWVDDGTSNVPHAFHRLAERDPAAARRFLARVTDPELRRVAETRIAMGIASSDPLTATVRARELDDKEVFDTALSSALKMGPSVAMQVMELNAGKFKTDVLALALQYPDVDWDSYCPQGVEASWGIDASALRSALRMSPDERAKLIEKLEKSSGTRANDALAEVVAAWAARDSKAAVEWAARHTDQSEPDHQANGALRRAIELWVLNDKESALRWLSALPDSELHRSLKLQVAVSLKEGDFAQVQNLLPQELGEDDQWEIEKVLGTHFRQRPADGAKWLSTLPDEVITRPSLDQVIPRWFSQDPAGFAEWIESLPNGRHRDRFVLEFAGQASHGDSAAAVEWVQTIEDPILRNVAARRVFDGMKDDGKRAALSWIRSCPNIDERYRAAIIRSVR